MSDDATRLFERPQLARTRPDRRVGNYYRGAADDGKAVGGIPLARTEAAVVAVVRMAYRVAEAQIDRSARLARRLREEGDRAVGPGSDRQALDATERLVFRAMMALLGWVEGVAADRGNPLQRLAAAQYRIVGSVLGLTPGALDERAAERAPRPGHAAHRADPGPPFPVRVRHVGEERRAVRVRAWEFAGESSPRKPIPVTFYHVADSSQAPLEGKILIAGRRSVTLTLATPRSARAGRWRAALCDAAGVQMGHMEIVL